MHRCLQLAQQGIAEARPNPIVGAVVVHNNTIIGEGYHRKFGGPHAEVNAINSVKDKSLLKDSTIYVSLEPCSHFGKTPPCADLIIKSQIPRVVISCTDTFSKVAGEGIKKLKAAGIEVITGILEEEGRELNRRFFTFHEKKRPYIILKWAQSADGFMDLPRDSGEKGIRWITNEFTRQLVHKWRSEEPVIVVGSNTWTNDQPSLTVRDYFGNNPERIVLGTSDGELVVHSSEELLNYCVSKNYTSLFIEGGSKTLTGFIESGTWDEARVLQGNVVFNSGSKAPAITGKLIYNENLNSGDSIKVFRNK